MLVDIEMRLGYNLQFAQMGHWGPVEVLDLLMEQHLHSSRR
jgi:hypothetical protein